MIFYGIQQIHGVGQKMQLSQQSELWQNIFIALAWSTSVEVGEELCLARGKLTVAQLKQKPVANLINNLRS